MGLHVCIPKYEQCACRYDSSYIYLSNHSWPSCLTCPLTVHQNPAVRHRVVRLAHGHMRQVAAKCYDMSSQTCVGSYTKPVH